MWHTENKIAKYIPRHGLVSDLWMASSVENHSGAMWKPDIIIGKTVEKKFQDVQKIALGLSHRWYCLDIYCL